MESLILGHTVINRVMPSDYMADLYLILLILSSWSRALILVRIWLLGILSRRPSTSCSAATPCAVPACALTPLK